MFWLGNLSEWLGVIAVMMIAGISPMLKKVRRIEFMYPRREFTYAFSLFALIFVFAYEVFSNPIFTFLKNYSANFWGGEVAERALVAVICLIPFIIALIARGQPLKSIGWHPDNLRAGLSVSLMLALLTVFLRGKFMTIIGGVSKEQTAALGIYLVLAVAEETIFRGYIQPRLQSQIGQRWGWLATAGLYMLWQLPGRIWIMPFTSLWVVLAVSLIQGLLLGWIMQKSGHVLVPILYRAVSLWMSVF
jgi:membrane protease YdiL (CAAX protease family)